MSEELDLLSDNRPIRYLEVDSDTGEERVIYRSSSIGACERALVATARKALAQPHPDWFQEVLDEGSAMESTIDRMWEDETGIETVDRQREFNLFIGEIDGRNVYVRSHVDGINGMDGTSIREFKKFRDSTWPKFLQSGVECNDNYPWQVSVSMHALTQELVEAGALDRIVACEFVGGHYHLLNGDEPANDGNPEIREIIKVEPKYIGNPPIPLKAIRLKVARIERLINQGYDLPEVPCEARMYPCPYYKYHDPKVELDTRIIEPDGEWTVLLDNYKAARESTTAARKVMDEHDATAKELRARIIERFGAAGIRAGSEVAIGDVTLVWTETNKDEYTVKSSVMTKVDIKKAPKAKTPRKAPK